MSLKTKITGALFAALTVAAPLALSASPAEAAPSIMIARDNHDNFGRDDNRFGRDNNRGHMDAYRDRNHRPPMRVEYRPHQPYGHYRWHGGAWNWSHNQWTWSPGIWIHF
jgi:hypothetical protein